MDIFKKGIKSFLFHILGAALGFAMQFLAAKLLGTTEFGRFNYLFGLASSISIIFSFGIAFYFPKVFQQKIDKNKLFSGIVFSSGIIFILFFSLFSVFYKPLISSLSDYIILFLLAWFLILIGYYRSYLIGDHSAEKASKIGNFYLKLWGLVFFVILLVLIGKSYLAFAIALIISHFIILLPFLIKTIKLTNPNFGFIKHASVFYFIQIFYSFFGEYAKVLQGEFSGLNVVAYLSISLVIGQIVTLFGTNFANVGLPIFASAYKENNIELMKEKFQEIARINAFFILPIFFLLIFNTPEILGIIGDEYKSGKLILLFILCGSFIIHFVGPNGSLLLMSGKERFELVNGIIKFIVAVSISLFFGRKFIWGIALGLAISDIVVNLLKAIEVYYFFNILPFHKKEAIYLILIAGIETILFGILTKLDLPIVLFLSVGSLLVVIFWIISFSKSPNKKDRKIYQNSISFCTKKLKTIFYRNE